MIDGGIDRWMNEQTDGERARWIKEQPDGWTGFDKMSGENIKNVSHQLTSFLSTPFGQSFMKSLYLVDRQVFKDETSDNMMNIST